MKIKDLLPPIQKNSLNKKFTDPNIITEFDLRKREEKKNKRLRQSAMIDRSKKKKRGLKVSSIDSKFPRKKLKKRNFFEKALTTIKIFLKKSEKLLIDNLNLIFKKKKSIKEDNLQEENNNDINKENSLRNSKNRRYRDPSLSKLISIEEIKKLIDKKYGFWGLFILIIFIKIFFFIF